MAEFLKNYVLGYVYGILYLPQMIVGLLLILAPGALVAYALSFFLPSILVSAAGLLTSLYVSTSEPYGSVIARVWPGGGIGYHYDD
jgi:hypothetical protein